MLPAVPGNYNNLGNNNRRNVNFGNANSDNNRFGNDAGLLQGNSDSMKIYSNLYQKLCCYDNLLEAFLKARKGKTKKDYVISFEQNLQNELIKLQWELLTHTYKPKPLTTFTVRDPKTRKISASDFRDRVIHHAVCNIVESIFERRFISDTYANRKGKGMPLGNLTSQFFANVYLSELDYFVKHTLRTKYYLRYVDDFVILERNRALLENYKARISEFLSTNLKIGLHPQNQ